MQLTLQYTLPPGLGTLCNHCDSSINIDDDYKYVKFIFGEERFDLHEKCFLAVLYALNKFDQVFIKEQQSEQGKPVH